MHRGLSKMAVTESRTWTWHFLSQSLKFLAVQNLEQNPGEKCFRSKSFRKYQIIPGFMFSLLRTLLSMS